MPDEDHETAYRQLHDREQQAAAVAQLGQVALDGMELPALFDLAVDQLAATLGVEFAKILELEPDGRSMLLVAGVGWRSGLVGAARLGVNRGSQGGFTLRQGVPVIVEDLTTEHRFDGASLLLGHGVRSGMSVIIGGAGGPWGVLGAHTARVRRFTPDDIHFLEAVANVLAGAIERRRAEDALRDRDERFELTLAASKTGIWEWDVVTGRLAWSSQILRLHGRAAEETPPDLDAYAGLIHPDDRDRFWTEVERAVADGVAFDLEYRIVWPDGSIHWTNGVGRVFFGPDGRPVRMFGIGRDITDRKRAEEERDRLLEAERQANALRDAFIGVLSHELRTPITTIYGGVKMLAREEAPLDDAARRSLLADVEAEADHLRRLVEDLLVISRAERGRIELGSEPIQLLHAARRAVQAESSRWPGIRFDVAPADGLPVASGDDTSLEQVLRNLLGNAAKYSPVGSAVTVITEATDDEVVLRVLDDGIGIAEDEVDQLFTLFYRSPDVENQVSGAGIGLFVAHRLVEAMGGRMWAHQRERGGSEFGFALRRYAVDADDEAEDAARA